MSGSFSHDFWTPREGDRIEAQRELRQLHRRTLVDRLVAKVEGVASLLDAVERIAPDATRDLVEGDLHGVFHGVALRLAELRPDGEALVERLNLLLGYEFQVESFASRGAHHRHEIPDRDLKFLFHVGVGIYDLLRRRDEIERAKQDVSVLRDVFLSDPLLKDCIERDGESTLHLVPFPLSLGVVVPRSGATAREYLRGADFVHVPGTYVDIVTAEVLERDSIQVVRRATMHTIFEAIPAFTTRATASFESWSSRLDEFRRTSDPRRAEALMAEMLQEDARSILSALHLALVAGLTSLRDLKFEPPPELRFLRRLEGPDLARPEDEFGRHRFERYLSDYPEAGREVARMIALLGGAAHDIPDRMIDPTDILSQSRFARVDEMVSAHLGRLSEELEAEAHALFERLHLFTYIAKRVSPPRLRVLEAGFLLFGVEKLDSLRPVLLRPEDRYSNDPSRTSFDDLESFRDLMIQRRSMFTSSHVSIVRKALPYMGEDGRRFIGRCIREFLDDTPPPGPPEDLSLSEIRDLLRGVTVLAQWCAIDRETIDSLRDKLFEEKVFQQCTLWIERRFEGREVERSTGTGRDARYVYIEDIHEFGSSLLPEEKKIFFQVLEQVFVEGIEDVREEWRSLHGESLTGATLLGTKLGDLLEGHRLGDTIRAMG